MCTIITQHAVLLDLLAHIIAGNFRYLQARLQMENKLCYALASKHIARVRNHIGNYPGIKS